MTQTAAHHLHLHLHQPAGPARPLEVNTDLSLARSLPPPTPDSLRVFKVSIQNRNLIKGNVLDLLQGTTSISI